MLKIIIPLAGTSDLFSKAGFFYPKPLIEINGSPMIQLVVEKTNAIQIPHKLVFILKEDEVLKFHLDNTLRLLSPNCEIVKLKNDTQGALCSILMAMDIIDPNDSLLILNGDQIIDSDFGQIIQYFHDNEAQVGVVTFDSVHPRWSFAKIENGLVVQTAEKNPISNHAIAGYYYFEKASAFFDCAFECILNDVQLDGKYYISPVINEFILKNQKVLNYNIDKSQYHSFYSPQLLNEYIKQL